MQNYNKSIFFMNKSIKKLEISSILTTSFNKLTKYLDDHKEIKKIYVQEKELSYKQLVKLISMKKEIVILSPFQPCKTIKLKEI